ncbi:hypothetical protein AB0E12_33095 [Micromonospora chersina]|uniref:hypothetical protein n=1 Tax=Micromonospora chersina TaxID=47854 RepID=UPI0033EB120F
MSIDATVVVRLVDSLRRVTHPPSEAEVVEILDRMGWARRRDDSFPQGYFFQREGLAAAVNSQDHVAFVTFNAIIEVGFDPDYSKSTAVLDELAGEVIQGVYALSGRELEDPGEEYDESAMDYIESYYRRLGPWVLSMGLVQLDNDDPIRVVLRMRYWEDLAKDYGSDEGDPSR